MIAAHRRAPAIDLAQRIGFWAENFSPTTTRLARINASVRDFLGCVIAGTRVSNRTLLKLASADESTAV